MPGDAFPNKPLDLEDEFEKIINRELVRELMVDRLKDASDAKLDELLAECNGNPWDVPIMDELKRIMGNTIRGNNDRNSDTAQADF